MQMKVRPLNRRAMPWHPPTYDDYRMGIHSRGPNGGQSTTLGGYQRMIADNCCRKSSNRSLAVIVATDETAHGRRDGTWMSVLCHTVLIGAGIAGRASDVRYSPESGRPEYREPSLSRTALASAFARSRAF